MENTGILGNMKNKKTEVEVGRGREGGKGGKERE